MEAGSTKLCAMYCMYPYILGQVAQKVYSLPSKCERANELELYCYS